MHQTKILEQNNFENSEFSDAEHEEEPLAQTQVFKKIKLKVNKLRVHYFFTEINNIEQFCKNTEIEIRLTDGPNWNKMLMQGKVYPFVHMNPKNSTSVQMQNSILYLFSDKIDDCYLTLKAGLMYDKTLNNEELTLYPFYDTYFSENHYYSSDPLPIEWLEIFESKEKLQELEEKSEVADLFDPLSNKNQLDYAKKPKSFLNKTLLESDQMKIRVKHPKPSKLDFIKLNVDLIKTLNKIKPDENSAKTSPFKEAQRPFTPRTNASSGLSKFVNSRPQGQFMTSRNSRLRMYRTNLEEVEDKELPTNTFFKTIENNDALKLTGRDRPVSAIQMNNHHSYTKNSERGSKSSLLDINLESKPVLDSKWPKNTKNAKYDR